MKGDTIEHFLLFYPSYHIEGINKNDKIKMKFEINSNSPAYATYETKFKLLPIPYSVKLYDEESLFSEKIHAVICRGWKNRVKGRDLYDYVFYLTRHTQFNLSHLRQKLIESHFISKEDSCTLNDVKNMLIRRFHSIDFEQAKNDVLPFVKDVSMLDVWSEEFFVSITQELENRIID